jgi:D-threo-aldose 1-dehydrogenase
MDPATTRELGRTGLALTRLGMGSAPLGDLWERIPEDRAEATLAAAWAGGVRYFDTAPWYGSTLAEHRLGHFLRQQPRRSFAISTKVGRVYARPADPDHVAPGIWTGGLRSSCASTMATMASCAPMRTACSAWACPASTFW